MSVLSAGPGIFDEQRQLLAFHNLRQGELFFVHEGEQFFQVESSGLSIVRHTYQFGDHTLAAHSPLVNFVSLPAYFILEFTDDLVPIAPLLTILWGFLAYWCLRWGWEWAVPRIGRGAGGLRGTQRGGWTARASGVGLDPLQGLVDWLRRTSPAHRVLLAVLMPLTLWQAWTVPAFDYDLWGEALAIQLTAIVAAAGAVVAFYALLRLLVPAYAGLGAAVLLTATPLAFWGTQIKYHGLMMCLVVFSLYFFTLGWQRKQLRWRALAIALSGLAVWNHLSGVFLVAGLGLAEFVHAPWPRRRAWRNWRRVWRPRTRSHAIALAALVVGLLPWMAYNTVLFGNPLTDHYFASGDSAGLDDALATGDAEAAGQKLDATQERYDQYYRHQREFRDSMGAWRGSVAVFLLAHEVEGAALGVLALTPLFVLAAAAPLAAARRLVPWPPAATLAVGLVAANWFFYVQRGPFQGAGYDLRYFTMSVPCLLLLAMMGLRWAVRDGKATMRAGATAYAAAALLLFAMLLALAHKNVLFDWRDEFLQTFVVMHVLGVAACAGILLAALGGRWLGRHQPAVLGAYLGIGLLVSHLWVATTQVLFHTGIPAHDGYEAFNHLLPLTHELHELFRRWLIPPKWGVA